MSCSRRIPSLPHLRRERRRGTSMLARSEPLASLHGVPMYLEVNARSRPAANDPHIHRHPLLVRPKLRRPLNIAGTCQIGLTRIVARELGDLQPVRSARVALL
jgi:hypothetical protein